MQTLKFKEQQKDWNFVVRFLQDKDGIGLDWSANIISENERFAQCQATKTQKIPRLKAGKIRQLVL